MKTFILIAAFLFGNLMVSATETKVMIRAKARDAKFIGTSLGGAHIIVRNKLNRKILAEGNTAGSTGNTDLIMKTPKIRGIQL